jgi:hypothetical protein
MEDDEYDTLSFGIFERLHWPIESYRTIGVDPCCIAGRNSLAGEQRWSKTDAEGTRFVARLPSKRTLLIFEGPPISLSTPPPIAIAVSVSRTSVPVFNPIPIPSSIPVSGPLRCRCDRRRRGCGWWRRRRGRGRRSWWGR